MITVPSASGLKAGNYFNSVEIFLFMDKEFLSSEFIFLNSECIKYTLFLRFTRKTKTDASASALVLCVYKQVKDYQTRTAPAY